MDETQQNAVKRELHKTGAAFDNYPGDDRRNAVFRRLGNRWITYLLIGVITETELEPIILFWRPLAVQYRLPSGKTISDIRTGPSQ
jgi:hypothetical protein